MVVIGRRSVVFLLLIEKQGKNSCAAPGRRRKAELQCLSNQYKQERSFVAI